MNDTLRQDAARLMLANEILVGKGFAPSDIIAMIKGKSIADAARILESHVSRLQLKGIANDA